MAALELTSNLKYITSGAAPTTSTLASGEFAFGVVNGKPRLYGNVAGVIKEYGLDSINYDLDSNVKVFLPTAVGQTGTYQTYTVPATSIYRITAAGARGGKGVGASYYGLRGGRGAQITADFVLNAGDVIRICVGQLPIEPLGQQQQTGDACGGPGGGMTIVLKKISTVDTTKVYQFTWGSDNWEVLLLAGGGGGTGDCSYNVQYRKIDGADAGAEGANLCTPDAPGTPTTTTTTGTSSSSFLGGSINQLKTNNGIGGYYTRNSYLGRGGYPCGGIQDDTLSCGGGWIVTAYTSETTRASAIKSFSSGLNNRGVSGANGGAGYAIIQNLNDTTPKFNDKAYLGAMFDENGFKVYSPSNPPPNTGGGGGGTSSPYVVTISSWSGSSGNYYSTISASTHGKGAYPSVHTYVQNGSLWEETYDSPAIDSSGNVTVYTNSAISIKVVIK